MKGDFQEKPGIKAWIKPCITKERFLLWGICLLFACAILGIYTYQWVTTIGVLWAFSAFLWAAWEDAKCGEIPNESVLLLLVGALVFFIFRLVFWTQGQRMIIPHEMVLFIESDPMDFVSIQEKIFGMEIFYRGILPYFAGFFALSLPLFILALWKNAFGMGDVKLMAAWGLYVGVQKVYLTFAIASILATLWAFPLLIGGKIQGKSHLRFGPFLFAGAMISLLWGRKILEFL